LSGKKWAAEAASFPRIKNIGGQREMMVFSGVGVGSFSRVEADLR
jgi:hypothetical protein